MFPQWTIINHSKDTNRSQFELSPTCACPHYFWNSTGNFVLSLEIKYGTDLPSLSLSNSNWELVFSDEFQR